MNVKENMYKNKIGKLANDLIGFDSYKLIDVPTYNY